MCFGKNIRGAGMWVLAFVIAQGMIYRWGYDTGYLYGTREGYADFFREQHSKAQSDEVFRAEQANARAGTPAPEGDALVATPTTPAP